MHCEQKKSLHEVLRLAEAQLDKGPRKPTDDDLEGISFDVPLILDGSMSKGVSPRDMSDVKKFLNRMLGIKIDQQKILFNYFFSVLQSILTAAKTEGLYTEGVSDIKGKVTRSCPPAVLWVDPISRLKTIKNELTVDRGMSFGDALKILIIERGLGDASGFYRSNYLTFGLNSYVMAIEKRSESDSSFKLYRPNCGMFCFAMTEEKFKEQFTSISEDTAEPTWTEIYENSLDSCTHAGLCPNRETCEVSNHSTSTALYWLMGRVSLARDWRTLWCYLDRW